MKKHLIATFIFIAYSVILIKVMVFKDVPIIRIGSLMLKFGGTQEGPANLVPFKTILPYLLGEKGLLIGAINLLGNIVLLVPIGFLVPFVFRNMTWKKTLALAVAAGFFIEGMQVVLHLGIFDIDDVILNAIGVVIGYWAFVILANWVRSGKYKTIIIIAIIVIATAVTALYAIYPKGQQQRMNSLRGAENGQSDRFDNEERKMSPGVDPCNGTGGTGQIISMRNNTITIKRNDGISQIIKLTDRTKIRTSMGPASESDLKTGDRVTVVIDSSETATLVLICNAAIK
ncbi:MAG TPA: VanZ family protein [Prolixibacteraceae bacterium]|nr:VanZ family protein [Prolixibacteraceae bacterium]